MNTRYGHIQGLQDNNKDITNTDKLLVTISELLKKLTEKHNRKTVLFNSGPTNLPNAVLIQPSNPDNINPVTGYTQILVKDILGRTADIFFIVNNGPGTIFALSVRGSSQFSQSEYQIAEGDRGTFYNVDEIRLRTTTANTEYIATENEMIRPKDVTFLKGRPYVRETNVAVAGVPNIELIVTDPVQGLGRNAHTGYIICDGPGNLLIRLSNNGTTFAPIQTIIPNQILNLDTEDIFTISVDASVNATKYRMAVH